MNKNNIIDCEEIAQQIKDELKLEIKSLIKKPRLCVVQVGDNQASNSYIKGKKKDCKEVGIDCWHIHKSEKCSEKELLSIIAELNTIPTIYGIIVQLPLPKHINVNNIVNAISAEKDVDGFRKDSLFIPCTPKGILTIIDSIGFDVSGKNCVVVGRSNIVGKPIAKLLLDRNATVTICHSKTKDLKKHTKNADLVVCAVGQESLISQDMVKENAVVIDVGINRNSQDKLCGDVERDVSDKAIITPVPKGIGLMTRVSLLENTLEAYKLQSKMKRKEG